MIERVIKYMEKYQMVSKGDTIVIGVSGGADSVCLLSMLVKLKKEWELKLHVVHINHGLRSESDWDANFVKGMCVQYSLPFYLVEADVRRLAMEENLTEEEAGRSVRYEAYFQILDKIGMKDSPQGKIAVAHNKNDRAETVLFHLFRGSGIKGLNGILPVRGCIIRPILCLERREVEAYLKENRFSYCIDPTNEEDTYTRNKIRNHILPYVEQEISENSVPHIVQVAELLEETEGLLQAMSEQGRTSCVSYESEDKVILEEAKFQKLPLMIQKYVLRSCLFTVAGSQKDITSKHIADLHELFSKQVGKTISLPYSVEAKKSYEQLILYRKGEEDKVQLPPVFNEVTIPETYELEDGRKIVFSLEKISDFKKIPEKRYTKWFDCDKIEKSLSLRNRQKGDFLTINAKYEKKSVKDYMINEKIPKEERDHVMLLADGSHILWIIGHRISHKYKVREDTKRILKVQVIGGSEDGGKN